VENVDPRAINALVSAHLGLVAIIARQLARELGISSSYIDDMESAGREGLLSVAKRFDPERGVPFKRFAGYRIRGAMLDALRRESRLTLRVRERLRGLESVLSLNEAAAEDPAPTSAAAADARLAERLANLATALATGLINEGVHDEGEQVAVELGDDPEEALDRAQLREAVRGAVEGLPEQERALITGHYFEGRRFDEVSAELGLSKSWGSRLHSRAVTRLTERLRPQR